MGAKAAVEMRNAILTYNASLNEETEKFKIKLNGIGVHCATGLLIDIEDSMIGESFNGAYHMGEDLASDGNVLFSKAVRDRVEDDPFFDKATFTILQDDEEVFIVGGEPGPLLDEQVPLDYVQDPPLHPGLVKLCKRHGAGDGLEALDKEISAGSLHTYTVLMFSLDLEVVKSNCSEASMWDVMKLKHQAIALLRPILEKQGG